MLRIPELTEAPAPLESPFQSWSAPGVPMVVECGETPLEEIRSQVAEGYRKFARGGLEVGGVLYGTHRPGAVRIEAVRPIACQHANGPSWALSPADRAALNQQLEEAKNDPELTGLAPVGWFCSHTRSGLDLTAADAEIFSSYFPEPWQVTLIAHPEGGAMSGCFFIRQADGNARVEFRFPDRPLRQRSTRKPAMEAQPAAAHVEPAAGSTRAEATPLSPAGPATKGKRKWGWLALWALVVAALGWLGVQWAQMNLTPQPLALELLDRDGELRIEWSAVARPVVRAARGWLYIADGDDSHTIDLTRQDLLRGELAYERKTGSVEVRLRVQNPSGQTQEEASRFVGTAPERRPTAEELQNLERQRKALEEEVARLRAQNSEQSRRIAELQNALRILEQRLAR